jgi:poly(A) polymerase
VILKRGKLSQKPDLGPYSGRWVAVIQGRVVGQGGTPDQAIQAAKMMRYKEIPEVMSVPTQNPLNFSPLLGQLRAALPADITCYLVGGAVRDAILRRPVHDYDFVLAGDALKVARRVANKIGAAYFPLDVERQTARLILTDDQEVRHVLDFATFRGPDLESDLRARDFTINALAVDVAEPQKLLDPMGGGPDLFNKLIRTCSPHSLDDDPVRILRAIRLAAGYGFRIQPETRALMGRAVGRLGRVSPERRRDELFRILSGLHQHTALRALDMLGVLPFVLPELDDLKNVAQSPPHVQDVWGHTLDTVRNLEALFDVLGLHHNPDASSNLILGLAVMQLGRYRQKIHDHFKTELVPERDLKSLLFLGALYHDIAKPLVHQEDVNGRVRFIDHDQQGGGIVVQRGQELRLSNSEIDRLKIMVQQHMRPTYLAREKRKPRPRSVYRFFRSTGSTGIEICLLSLADLLATYGNTLPQERWAQQLEVVRSLLAGWWDQPEKQVQPPTIVTGHDLMVNFDLPPGPQIGELLELIREAQVTGEVTSKPEALTLINTYLNAN